MGFKRRMDLKLLRELVSYDQIQKIWWDKQSNCRMEVFREGNVLCVSVSGQVFKEKRLAHYYVHGSWNKHSRLHRHSGKGVDYHRTSRRYRARVRYDGIQRVIGYYKTEEEAVNAVTISRWKLKYYGKL